MSSAVAAGVDVGVRLRKSGHDSKFDQLRHPRQQALFLALAMV
eukprot:CAMPEP_0206039244 /NCGR_PEP_ID=MMETSP1466-20131121/4631_1 /ASSEMBLY_ACC=CAM_ASM_001126 /TAXON_ID=44452 /ORGANISM="Pavlova gyrans, Strain CCMP608" /LENGTH=42 /DNA_ID= /DNA_START= /DNA_END= /DNA_ORIENTATION=